MEILIVSNYYPPEKGAAANRIAQMAEKLKAHHFDVSVVCPLANYPQGKLFPEHRGKFSVFEVRRGIAVSRLWIYPSNSKNAVRRLFSIASFSTMLSFYLLFKKIPSKVIVQSPPLLLSFIAVAALSIRRRQIILNVSDLWPSAALELGALRESSSAHRVSLFFERFIYKRADIVLGQSDEILKHVDGIVQGKKSFLYRNYPEHADEFSLRNSVDATIRIFYAGLLGVAQGVLKTCSNIELSQNMELHIFGDGAEKADIETYIANRSQHNIFFHGMLDRARLHETLTGFGIALVPLATRIYGSVPSKIFEYGALGFPILYFGGGEGENIVSENDLGWVAKVADFNSLNTKLSEISAFGKEALIRKKRSVYQTARQRFSLDEQIKRLIESGVFQ